VPGRLGLLVTLYLIATNVYNSVTAPTQRGFSFIEIWMIGVQIPILTGVVEYGILLAMKKYHKVEMNSVSKTVDMWTFSGSLLFIMIFNMIYWSMGLQ
jgi:hypothetical protein